MIVNGRHLDISLPGVNINTNDKTEPRDMENVIKEITNNFFFGNNWDP